MEYDGFETVAKVGFSPRQPGLVLLLSDLRSIVLKLKRAWQAPAMRGTHIPGAR